MRHFQVHIFYAVIDMQVQELNGRFTEVNTKLLLYITCLCPHDSFYSFVKERFICLANHYPKEFSPTNFLKLDDQLGIYICDVRSSTNFAQLRGIGDLAKKMVKKKKSSLPFGL